VSSDPTLACRRRWLDEQCDACGQKIGSVKRVRLDRCVSFHCPCGIFRSARFGRCSCGNRDDIQVDASPCTHFYCACGALLGEVRPDISWADFKEEAVRNTLSAMRECEQLH